MDPYPFPRHESELRPVSYFWLGPPHPRIYTGSRLPSNRGFANARFLYREKISWSTRAADLRRFLGRTRCTRRFDFATSWAARSRRSTVRATGWHRQVRDGTVDFCKARHALASRGSLLQYFAQCRAEAPATTRDSPANPPENRRPDYSGTRKRTGCVPAAHAWRQSSGRKQ